MQCKAIYMQVTVSASVDALTEAACRVQHATTAVQKAAAVTPISSSTNQYTEQTAAAQ